MKNWIKGAIVGAAFPILMNILVWGLNLSKIFENVFATLLWALIGALIGWLIGKIDYVVIIKKASKKKK